MTVNVAAANVGGTLNGVDNGSGHYKIATSGVPGATYNVEAETDGVGGFVTIATGIVADVNNGLFTWTDPDLISAHTSRIYRLVQP